VNWSSSEWLTNLQVLDFFHEFSDGGELLVLVEYFPKCLQELFDVFINPMSALELFDELEAAKIDHDLKTLLILGQ